MQRNSPKRFVSQAVGGVISPIFIQHQRRFCQPTRISANRRFGNMTSMISSRLLTVTKLPITKKSLASCSAMIRRKKSLICWFLNASRRVLICKWGARSKMLTNVKTVFASPLIQGLFGRNHWWWQPAACRSRKLAQQVSAISLPNNSDCRLLRNDPALCR